METSHIQNLNQFDFNFSLFKMKLTKYGAPGELRTPETSDTEKEAAVRLLWHSQERKKYVAVSWPFIREIWQREFDQLSKNSCTLPTITSNSLSTGNTQSLINAYRKLINAELITLSNLSGVDYLAPTPELVLMLCI